MAMERVTVEQNGERFTLEVPEGTSDDQIKSFLQEQQGTKKEKEGEDLTPLLAPAAAAAVPAVAKGMAAIPEAYQTAKTVANPALSGTFNAAKDIAGTYIKNPGTFAADVAASHLGLPPPSASIKAQPMYSGIQQSYQNVKDLLNKTGQFAPKAAPAPTTVAPASDMAQAAELAANMTPEEMVAHMGSGQSQAQLAAQQASKTTQAAKTAQIMATQGPSAVEGSNFIQTITEKFAPLAAKVAPVLNNPVVRAVGTGANAVAPLQALHGASEQAATANMNSPEFNIFGSTARGGKSFADWFNEISGQNRKYEEMRKKQRQGLTGQ